MLLDINTDVMFVPVIATRTGVAHRKIMKKQVSNSTARMTLAGQASTHTTSGIVHFIQQLTLRVHIYIIYMIYTIYTHTLYIHSIHSI